MERLPENWLIVELLVGPDNTSNYVGWAFALPNGKLKIWQRFVNRESFQKHAELLTGQAEEQVEQWLQAGYCMKCGRLLTVPESIMLGLGPICRGKT